MTSFQNDSQFVIEDNVLKGKVVPYHDDYMHLGEFILRRFEATPDFVGQIDVVTGEEYTYRKMRERSVRCALWMQSQGLRPRDVVVVCSNDHSDSAMPCYASLYLGAIFSPWGECMEEDDFRHQMNIAKPKVAFVSESKAAVVAAAAKKEGLDLKIIVFGRVPGFLEFESIIAEPGIDEVNRFNFVPIESPDEIAVIIFSSGTTGLPKGIELSHRSVIFQTHQADAMGMTAGNICFVYSPPKWIDAMDAVLTTLFVKIPRIVLPLFEGWSAHTHIEKYKPSFISFTSYTINRLVNYVPAKRHDLTSVTRVLYSGSTLSEEIYKSIKELMPNVQITGAYGMTESCGHISIQTPKSHPNSCGEILENAQVKVIDLDTGLTLGPNQNGELLLKLPSMMSGYRNDPLATAEVIDEEGWLHSGDFGYYTEGGEIFVRNRIKDIIRCSDYDLSPIALESVIRSHSGVKEVAVVGQPRDNGDDLPIAFVVRSEVSSNIEKQVTETDIVDLVAAELQDSKQRLRGGVRFVDHLPKTATGKVRRMVLRDWSRVTVTTLDPLNGVVGS